MSQDPDADRPGERASAESPERRLLDDSGSVLQVRAHLDALTLDVLSSPGLGEPEVSRLHTFLTGDWERGVLALRRLQASTEDLP